MNVKVRPVNKDDCYDLWLWRNNIMVRENSFNMHKISYKRHKKWFEENIKNGDIRIYIAENERREKVGQARFKVAGKNRSYINVNLNPIFFGKGLGRVLIKKATKSFLKEKYNIREIRADVLEKNIASKKAFEKAGYSMMERGRKNNRKILILVFREEN